MNEDQNPQMTSNEPTTGAPVPMSPEPVLPEMPTASPNDLPPITNTPPTELPAVAPVEPPLEPGAGQSVVMEQSTAAIMPEPVVTEMPPVMPASPTPAPTIPEVITGAATVMGAAGAVNAGETVATNPPVTPLPSSVSTVGETQSQQPAIPGKDGQSQFAAPPTAPKKKSLLPLLLIVLGLLIVGAVAFYFYNSYLDGQERIAAENQAAIERQEQLQAELAEQERLQQEAEAAANAEAELMANKTAALQELQGVLSASDSALATVTPAVLGEDNNYFGYDEYFCEAEDNYFPYTVTSQLLVAETLATDTEVELEAARTAIENQLTVFGWMPRTIEFCSTAAGVGTGAAMQPNKMVSFFEKNGVQVAFYVNPTDKEGTYADPAAQNGTEPTLEVQIFSDLDAQVARQRPFTSQADYSAVAEMTAGIAEMPLETTGVGAIDWPGEASTSASVYKAFYGGAAYRIDMSLSGRVWVAESVFTEAI